MRTKKARVFNLFGFGGMSKQTYDAEKDSSEWEDDGERYNSLFFSNTGAAGLSHSIILNNKMYLKSTVSASINDIGFESGKLDHNYSPQQRDDDVYNQEKLSATTVLNYKHNARLSIRSGITATQSSFSIIYKTYDEELSRMTEVINGKGDHFTMSAFSQAARTSLSSKAWSPCDVST